MGAVNLLKISGFNYIETLKISMKKLLILGAGTAGTMMANHLNRKLSKKEWEITIVDQHKTHYYQPGFLFIPFGIYNKKDVIKHIFRKESSRKEII